MYSAGEVYPNPDAWTRCRITVYDVRDVEALARFRFERTVWREYGDVEALDEHHYALIVRSDLARGKAA